MTRLLEDKMWYWYFFSFPPLFGTCYASSDRPQTACSSILLMSRDASKMCVKCGRTTGGFTLFPPHSPRCFSLQLSARQTKLPAIKAIYNFSMFSEEVQKIYIWLLPYTFGRVGFFQVQIYKILALFLLSLLKCWRWYDALGSLNQCQTTSKPHVWVWHTLPYYLHSLIRKINSYSHHVIF